MTDPLGKEDWPNGDSFRRQTDPILSLSDPDASCNPEGYQNDEDTFHTTVQERKGAEPNQPELSLASTDESLDAAGGNGRVLRTNLLVDVKCTSKKLRPTERRRHTDHRNAAMQSDQTRGSALYDLSIPPLNMGNTFHLQTGVDIVPARNILPTAVAPNIATVGYMQTGLPQAFTSNAQILLQTIIAMDNAFAPAWSVLQTIADVSDVEPLSPDSFESISTASDSTTGEFTVSTPCPQYMPMSLLYITEAKQQTSSQTLDPRSISYFSDLAAAALNQSASAGSWLCRVCTVQNEPQVPTNIRVGHRFAIDHEMTRNFAQLCWLCTSSRI